MKRTTHTNHPPTCKVDYFATDPTAFPRFAARMAAASDTVATFLVVETSKTAGTDADIAAGLARHQRKLAKRAGIKALPKALPGDRRRVRW